MQAADVCDARLMGADAVLLIAAALDDDELASAPPWPSALGLDALVEVHDEAELDRALAAGAAAGRGQPAGPAHLRRRPRAGLRVGGARSRPGWWPWPSPGSGTPTTPGGWPTPATTPCWWARRWCARPIGPRQLRQLGRASRSGRDERRACSSRSAASPPRPTPCSRSASGPAVGFIFAPSPRQVSVQLAGDIVKRLPEHVLTVGVFRDEAPQRVVEIVRLAGLGAAQLHGHETAEETQWVRARVPHRIKAFPAGDRTIARFEEFGADYLLIDGPTRARARSSTGGWPRGWPTPPPDRLRRPAPRQRGPGRGPPAPLRGRRVDRGRVRARAARTPCCCSDFIANARQAAAEAGGRATRWRTPRRRRALRLEGRVSDGAA